MTTPIEQQGQTLPSFQRSLFSASGRSTGIGEGEIGGKAHGLMLLGDILREQPAVPDLHIDIPAFTVIRTSVFERFMDLNKLHGLAVSEMTDDAIALAFQKANLPAEILGDLRALVKEVHTPLAIRSSSLLEDSLHEPFAGIYETKMLPNNQHDPDERFRKLVEAVKFVYSATFSQMARDYLAATGHHSSEEKMAIIIQEVVGQRFGERFYPVVSGVSRSYNFYSIGRARPEEGAVSLALGLGKTIVDGGLCWTYSPAHPTVGPPYGSPGELLEHTQKDFWALNMGKPPAYDPIRETEYLVKGTLADAEKDGTLKYTASTYDPHSRRITMGVGSPGPRALDFALLLRTHEFRINDPVSDVLAASQKALGSAVEIEFAATLSPNRVGFLQVRPMMVSSEEVEISNDEWSGKRVFAASDRVLGNGTNQTIQDIVYVKPANFEPRHSRQIALELEKVNRTYLSSGRKYLLIGFGRWGSSDPWLGIPVNWGQISGAGAIIETVLENQNVEMSQGSHFFHNLLSFRVSHFTISPFVSGRLEWSLLEELPAAAETRFVRCVQPAAPLSIKVDGRTGRGTILFPEGDRG